MSLRKVTAKEICENPSLSCFNFSYPSFYLLSFRFFPFFWEVDYLLCRFSYVLRSTEYIER